jgi:two-component system, LytTR family, response regulator
VRALIADDEPLARERVRELLRERSDITIAAEARDGEETLRICLDAPPDLLLLDVQMPGLDGFEVLAELDAARMPAVVFITAFDEYAVRAFDVQAADYLVKPFHRARFHAAIDRALARRGDATVRHTAAELRNLRVPLTRFIVRAPGEIYFVRATDVSRIESAGNYVRLHTADREHIVRMAMRAVEERLDGTTFVRVHRGTIVNLDYVTRLQPYFHGEFVITMRDGAQVTSSRSYSARLRELLAT